VNAATERLTVSRGTGRFASVSPASVALPAICLLAFVLRLAIVIGSPHFHPVTDAIEYDRDAVSLARHGHLPSTLLLFNGTPTALHPPFFPAALAVVYKIVGTGSTHTRWEAGRIFEALLGALTVWLVALVVRRIWDARVALVAAGIAAIYPPLVLIGTSLLSESLFIPLVLAALWAALVYREDPRLRWTVISGVFLGLSALTRGNGFLLVIPLAGLAWIGRPWRSWAAVRAPLLLLLAALAVMTPWTIRNLRAFHTLVPVTTETGYTLEGTYNSASQHDKIFPALWVEPELAIGEALRANPGANEAQIGSQMQHEALHYIRAHPSSLLRTVYWNARRMLNISPELERLLAPYEGYPPWLSQLSAYAFWALLLLSALALLIGRGLVRRASWWFWVMPVLSWVPALLLEGNTRYRVPADPFMLPLAAIALLVIYDRVRPGPAAEARA
jgi:4-amino-4-deoxy-L-arabinose transferase-like glycosyltransferase